MGWGRSKSLCLRLCLSGSTGFSPSNVSKSFFFFFFFGTPGSKLHRGWETQPNHRFFFIPILRNPTEGGMTSHRLSERPRYDNVIAVELMNEPPLGGLPNCCVCMGIWRSILSFQVSVFSVCRLGWDETAETPVVFLNVSSLGI